MSVMRKAGHRGYFLAEEIEQLAKSKTIYQGKSLCYMNSILACPAGKLRDKFVKHNPEDFDKDKYFEWESFVKAGKKGVHYLPEYWQLLESLSYEEALLRVDKFKKDKVTSLEGFISRHGKRKGTEAFEEFKRTSAIATEIRKERGDNFREGSRWCIEYWMTREGKTEEEAKECVSIWQRENAGVFENIWLKNGYSKEEVSKIIKEQDKQKGKFFKLDYHLEAGLTLEEAESLIKDKLDRVRNTFVEKGLAVPVEDEVAFSKYKWKAYQATNMNDLSSLPNIEKRGRLYGYEVDHRFSLLAGFLNNVPVEVISCLGNLQCITSKENNTKGQKCDITLEELYKSYNQEFNKSGESLQ